MNVTIITPAQTQIYEVAWLELNTPCGNMIVQRGHAPMIITVTPHLPIIFRLKSGKQETILPRAAIVEISRESTMIILSVVSQ